MGNKILEDLYKSKSLDTNALNFDLKFDKVSDREKFKAAKQILLGLSVLYILTIAAFMIRPECNKLLDIITITFPPIATLILAAYFRDKPQ